jgi:cytochrome P450
MAARNVGESTAAANESTPPGDNVRLADAGLLDVAKLVGTLGAGKLNAGFDAQAAGCKWARAALAGQDALRIGLAGKSVDVVGSREYSDDILAGSRLSGGLPPGALKTEAMRFLAPHALTIASGEVWSRLRRLNEAVLGTNATHPWAQTFLGHVRNAFDRAVSDRKDVRRSMGHAMTGIVLGAPDDALVHDVNALFAAVQSPLRRKLLGFLYGSRRNRLYKAITRGLETQGPAEQTLIALARMEGADIERDVLAQQVPHWMFTFTGSGTDLLARTMAMVTSRPTVLRRALEDSAQAGPLDQAASMDRMHYLNACLLETGRLFTPVTRTVHRSAGGNDIVHYFPLLQRDETLGPSVHDFRPERWLADGLDAAAAASNLFLRGPRACPGRDLILFVCRAALASQLQEQRVRGKSVRLARDPLPLSFPEREIRFTVAEATP